MISLKKASGALVNDTIIKDVEIGQSWSKALKQTSNIKKERGWDLNNPTHKTEDISQSVNIKLLNFQCFTNGMNSWFLSQKVNMLIDLIEYTILQRTL